MAVGATPPRRVLPVKTVFVLNGPNLNLLGTREPAVYGAQTLADVEQICAAACARHGFALRFHQSNHEGALIDWIHEAGRLQVAGELAGLVLNADARIHELSVESEAANNASWAINLVRREADRGDEGAKAILARLGV